MSIEKQKLYNEIDTLPEELADQVINYIEYLKLSCVNTDAPESVTIKSKEELNGLKNIRKVNVRNYVIFYIVDEEKSKHETDYKL